MDRPYPTSLTFTPTSLEVAESSIVAPIIFSVFVTTNTAVLQRSSSLATGSALCPMAICPAQCCYPSQQSASAGGRHIQARAIQLNFCWKQQEARAHFRLSSVRVAKRTCFRQIFAKMATSRSPWAQSWTKPNTRNEYLPGTQLNYRVCHTSVSLSL